MPSFFTVIFWIIYLKLWNSSSIFSFIFSVFCDDDMIIYFKTGNYDIIFNFFGWNIFWNTVCMQFALIGRVLRGKLLLKTLIFISCNLILNWKVHFPQIINGPFHSNCEFSKANKGIPKTFLYWGSDKLSHYV